jgi:AcrR family transcriptional regulator
MKSTPRRGRPREFDKNDALRKAMELFWARGYDATTLPELQAAMGDISPPSFYAAFGSKEQLFADAVELYNREVACDSLAALMDGPTARAGIEGLMRENIRMLLRPAAGNRGCLTVLGSLNSTNPAAEKLLRSHRIKGQAAIRDRIRRGIADGDVPKSANVDGMVTYYTTVLFGLALSARDGVSPAGLTGVVDAAIATWDTLIGAGTKGRRARVRPRA